MSAASTAGDEIPCSHPAPKPPATAYDCMMTIQVTEDPQTRKKFRLYRGVLCFHSDFFDRALNGSFKESGRYFYEVKDCTIATFQIFYDWVNTGMQDKKLDSQQAIDLFVFADFYAVRDLKNRALEAYHCSIVDQCETKPSTLNYVYLQTVESSPLRELAMDIVVETWKFDNIRGSLSGWSFPEELWLDLLETCRVKKFIDGSESEAVHDFWGRKASWDCTARARFCERYHDHGETEGRAVQADEATPQKA